MKEQAEAASRAKDHFLAQLSRELRTPLTPVLMTVAALRDDETLPDAARGQLAMVARNISLEARLIDDLLDLTHITRGRLTLRTEPCDVHSLLCNVVDLRDTHGLRGIALSGYGMEDDLGRSREAGFIAHLVKPVDIVELRRALSRVGAGADVVPSPVA